MNKDLDDPRLTAVGLLAEAYTGLMNRLAAQFEEHRLSQVEFEVLMRLARSPGNHLRMTDLAGQTTLSTSGVTRVVDRMERTGLVRREACPSDRRSSYAVITDSGMQRLADVLPGHLELVQRWYVGLLPETKLTELLDSLRTIRDAVNPCATAGSAETALPAA
ncbi:MarR family winged helix-turn-helix transcriptional regulator [Actinoplanes xinjiangensis]|uniref:DNA-binding MarR family transcriptional regulator n=1 Tax=Actinoplanes xinjiangensis TaxID=512350 RepID=A0A316EJF3_9ACTN|nr:MarR family transcriptional regulator [Actinoplanes xinjiangensis]PWK30282.1 DNA-binding MarR family transcriptional regulator [Actinoplanes xinjiangensis]GIF44377.1 MarR family transcriptional regulator [Actinoplanes xinjiangensis]